MAREDEFLEYVQSGGQIETDDWMPDEYRARLRKFIEMHGNSELMGVLPEREWILRAPTLQRKLALTAKVQDEVGHAQLIYRVVEDLGKPREQCLEDLISGKSKFHNVFLTLMLGTDDQRELVQEALNRWWGPLMQFHGNPIPSDEDPMYVWRIKSQGNDEARQQFLDGYVPQIWELGLTVPDPKLRKDEKTGRWHYTEPDWDALKHVVTGHGPKTADRLDLRRMARENSAWVRQVVLAEAA